MKQKEIATALGLSVALAVTGCGTTNEPVEIVQVEESTPTEVEEPTEPVEVIEADTTAPEVENVDESLITISEDEEPLHDTEVDEQKEVTSDPSNPYIGKTIAELNKILESPEFSKLSLEEQMQVIDALAYAPESQLDSKATADKEISQTEIDKMSYNEVKAIFDNDSLWYSYNEPTREALLDRMEKTNPNNVNNLINKHNQEVSGGGQTDPQPDSGCYMPTCEADNGCYTPQADGWISY